MSNNIEKQVFKPQNDSLENKNKLNIYGKEKFLPEEARCCVEKIINDFKGKFSSCGYKEEASVPISSGIDPTVRFIGSQISILKPYFMEKRVPSPGVFMQQNCLRTKNLDNLLDDDFRPNWGSYFPNLGAITPPERIVEGCGETFDFFENNLGVSQDNILIRINSLDEDLMKICRQRYGEKNLEIDSKKIDYYKHKFGEKGIGGRNCNIALRNSDGSGFSDVANLIIIEDDNSKLCLEISIGVSTTLKQIYGLDHVQDCTPVIGLSSIDENFRRKFEDSVITSTVLFREGLRPLGDHNRNRILKKYIQAMSYFRSKCNMSFEELGEVIKKFEEMEFIKNEECIAEVMMDYLKAFENELLHKKNFTEDQQKIKKELSFKII